MSTALVIEDNANQRILYRQELEDEGYKVITAADGQEGIQLLKQKQKRAQPDIVILDIHMPRGDGIDVLARILAINHTMPVIIYTAYTNYQSNFLTWAASAYLVKNSDLTELKNKIKELIETNGTAKRIGVQREL